MINALEIRLGNFYSYADWKQDQMEDMENIFNWSIHHFASELNKLDQYNPIVLTEEWLKKFGFESAKEGGEYFELSYFAPIMKHTIILRVMLNNKGWWFIIDCYETDKGVNLGTFNYVHQLQNLYFALTGDELTLS